MYGQRKPRNGAELYDGYMDRDTPRPKVSGSNLGPSKVKTPRPLNFNKPARPGFPQSPLKGRFEGGPKDDSVEITVRMGAVQRRAQRLNEEKDPQRKKRQGSSFGGN